MKALYNQKMNTELIRARMPGEPFRLKNSPPDVMRDFVPQNREASSIWHDCGVREASYTSNPVTAAQ